MGDDHTGKEDSDWDAAAVMPAADACLHAATRPLVGRSWAETSARDAPGVIQVSKCTHFYGTVHDFPMVNGSRSPVGGAAQ